MSLNYEPVFWQPSSSSRIPFWVYTDAQRHQQELDKIFYGAHWCYVGLEVEIPNMGDYKLNHVDDKHFDDWPYYMRQVISPARITSHVDDVMKAETNYAVCRTKPDCVSEVYNVGRYIDQLIKKGDSWKFRSRLCLYDREMILNSLIYPV